ncbi:MAG: transcription termination factor Rho, partial [Planctomycetota bacterium]
MTTSRARSRKTQKNQQTSTTTGILEQHPKGYGFLRREDPFRRSPDDIFASPQLIRRHSLRQGDLVGGLSRGGRLLEVRQIDGVDADETTDRIRLEQFRACSPTRPIRLEHDPNELCTRVMDLLCPIGFGQRVLIAAPPRCGKTTLLQNIIRGINQNHPQVRVMILLVDERPEEITELQETTRGEIYASCVDDTLSSHTQLAELTLQRAHRLVEWGNDVVLLVDSLTRLTRAHNKLAGAQGLIGPGGLRVNAVESPRRLFASGRAFKEHAGSLTVIATALIGTDNRMDEVIFHEFKGTGNTDIMLDQDLAERGIWPAINLRGTGTRRSELLCEKATQEAIAMLRRSVLRGPKEESTRMLIERLTNSST